MPETDPERLGAGGAMLALVGLFIGVAVIAEVFFGNPTNVWYNWIGGVLSLVCVGVGLFLYLDGANNSDK